MSRAIRAILGRFERFEGLAHQLTGSGASSYGSGSRVNSRSSSACAAARHPDGWTELALGRLAFWKRWKNRLAALGAAAGLRSLVVAAVDVDSGETGA
jgi:hypothetical protein